MLSATLVMIRVPHPGGKFEQHDLESVVGYLDHQRVDTVIPITAKRRAAQGIPDTVKSVIRYTDVVSGYRLLYVEEEASVIARAKFRLDHGEDPLAPDYSGTNFA